MRATQRYAPSLTRDQWELYKLPTADCGVRRKRYAYDPAGDRYERRFFPRVQRAIKRAWLLYLRHVDRHVDVVSRVAIMAAFGGIGITIFAEAARRIAP
jgi:hypothetical protein